MSASETITEAAPAAAPEPTTETPSTPQPPPSSGSNTVKFSTAVSSPDPLPSSAVLTEILSMTVLDGQKQPHTLRSLLSTTQRTLLVFIRHFFCGNCTQYISALTSSSHLSPKSLPSLHPDTQLVIIGCGDPSLIPQYSTRTPCPYPLYADPTRKMYEKLNFVETLSQGSQKPGYMTKSFVANLLSSAGMAASAGIKMNSGGKISQNGGEMVFEVTGTKENGEKDVKCTWVHRMKNSTDHAEVKTLEEALGVGS